MEEKTSEFRKDYTNRICKKVISDTGISEKEEIPNDINNLIIFLNYCFMERNNFFVPSFNSYKIKDICCLYTQLKTNIMSRVENDLFVNITHSSLKTLRFIIGGAVNNYLDIEKNNNELCSIISRESFQRLFVILNNALKLKSQG